MPSLEGLRGPLIEELEGLCLRTGMYASTTGHADGLCWHVLKHMAYIDDREESYTVTLHSHMEADFGPLGPALMGDWFFDARAARHSGPAEVVAWYAELAAGYGWIAPPSVSSEEWERLLDAVALPCGLDGWTAERLNGLSLIFRDRL